VAAIIGEAGVGKSRLFWEFPQSLRTHGWLVLESRSVSYGKAIPFLPVIELLKAYFQIDGREDARRVREQVTAHLQTLDEALEPTLPVFLALLDVPVGDPHWQALDPPQRRQAILNAVKRLLLRESQGQPIPPGPARRGVRPGGADRRGAGSPGRSAGHGGPEHGTLVGSGAVATQGEFLLQCPVVHPGEAEACFERALDIARYQQAKSLELRATLSLSRLWHHQGKHHEARQVLAPIYGWFTEGFDTADLQEAKALLDEWS
jgi:hypothetical protein